MVSRYSEHSFLWVHISKKSPSLRLMQHISLISQIWTLQLAYCLSYSLIFFFKKRWQPQPLFKHSPSFLNLGLDKLNPL